MTNSTTATTTSILAQSDDFKVESGYGERNRLHITVKGLGVVTLNKTYEGLIIDVHNKGIDDSIDSLAIQNGDFAEFYTNKLQSIIKQFDKEIDVSISFLEVAWEKRLELTDAVQKYFSDGCFDVLTLKGLKGVCGEYHDQVKKLQRPYIKISAQTNRDLTNAKYDYYQTNTGKVVTFGYADYGFFLMPLKDMYAIEILANQ